MGQRGGRKAFEKSMRAANANVGRPAGANKSAPVQKVLPNFLQPIAIKNEGSWPKSKQDASQRRARLTLGRARSQHIQKARLPLPSKRPNKPEGQDNKPCPENDLCSNTFLDFEKAEVHIIRIGCRRNKICLLSFENWKKVRCGAPTIKWIAKAESAQDFYSVGRSEFEANE